MPSNFDYIFVHLRQKSTSQARIKPDIFVNFRPEPDPKSPARLTTLSRIRRFHSKTALSILAIGGSGERPLSLQVKLPPLSFASSHVQNDAHIQLFLQQRQVSHLSKKKTQYVANY